MQKYVLESALRRERRRAEGADWDRPVLRRWGLWLLLAWLLPVAAWDRGSVVLAWHGAEGMGPWRWAGAAGSELGAAHLLVPVLGLSMFVLGRRAWPRVRAGVAAALTLCIASLLLAASWRHGRAFGALGALVVIWFAAFPCILAGAQLYRRRAGSAIGARMAALGGAALLGALRLALHSVWRADGRESWHDPLSWLSSVRLPGEIQVWVVAAHVTALLALFLLFIPHSDGVSGCVSAGVHLLRAYASVPLLLVLGVVVSTSVPAWLALCTVTKIAVLAFGLPAALCIATERLFQPPLQPALDEEQLQRTFE